MLNRRLIRIRAMQTLYSYEKSKGANFMLALDLISEAFMPDLNSMEKQDKPKLLGLKKIASKLFSDEISDGKFSNPEDIPADVRGVLTKAKELYKNRNAKDFQNISVSCQIDAEKVYDIYLYILKLLVEISLKYPSNESLGKNKAIKAIANSKDLDYQCIKRGISWENERIFINKIYNEVLKNNEHLLEYSAKVNQTLEDHLAIVKYIIKNVILKHEICSEFFDKMNIYWQEDRDILRTMLFSSFKDFLENEAIVIEKLDEVWEESKQFLLDLFKLTVQNDKLYMSYLVPFLRNWEIDRIVETDRILLKMAVAELINFPSIPIKVTINEIIDISKNFSTAKSGTFINGILDSVTIELTKNGNIKKSGRGMIDK